MTMSPNTIQPNVGGPLVVNLRLIARKNLDGQKDDLTTNPKSAFPDHVFQGRQISLGLLPIERSYNAVKLAISVGGHGYFLRLLSVSRPFPNISHIYDRLDFFNLSALDHRFIQPFVEGLFFFGWLWERCRAWLPFRHSPILAVSVGGATIDGH
jgi:hypothetical protein